MGLGKTIQTLGLILLAPPPGVEYRARKAVSEKAEETIQDVCVLEDTSAVVLQDCRRLQVKVCELEAERFA